MTFDPGKVAAVFGRAAAAYDTVIPFFTTFGARLVEAAALDLGDRVLDVGSGRGATLLPASVAVGPTGRVVGVDLAEEMVVLLGADLEAAGIDNATVRSGNVEALDIEAATFDVALCQMVLHLVPEPETAAAELFRVLVPGGRCVASVPSGSPGWDFMGEIYARFGPRAVRPMDLPFRRDFDLPATVAGAGFEIVDDRQVEAEFHFPDEQAHWDWGWSHGFRALYEVLTPDDLEAMREATFAALATRRTAEGIPLTQQVRMVTGRRPPG